MLDRCMCYEVLMTDLEKLWAFTTPGAGTLDNPAHADGSKWIQVWDEGYFDGPTLRTRKEMEEFIAELLAIADGLWGDAPDPEEPPKMGPKELA